MPKARLHSTLKQVPTAKRQIIMYYDEVIKFVYVDDERLASAELAKLLATNQRAQGEVREWGEFIPHYDDDPRDIKTR